MLQSRSDLEGRAHPDGGGIAVYHDGTAEIERRAAAAYECLHFSVAEAGADRPAKLNVILTDGHVLVAYGGTIRWSGRCEPDCTTASSAAFHMCDITPARIASRL